MAKDTPIETGLVTASHGRSFRVEMSDGEIVEDRRQAGHGGRIAGKLESDPNLSQGNGGRIPIPDGERPVGSQTSTESGSDPDSRSVHGAVP